MNTKVSPLMSGGITALITAILAVGATIGVLNATTGTITTLNTTTLAASTVAVGGGTAMDKHLRTTATINPDSMTFYANTSSNVTLTGAVANDHCSVSALSGDIATSTVRVACVTGTDLATIYFINTASTTFNPITAVFSVQVTSY